MLKLINLKHCQEAVAPMTMPATMWQCHQLAGPCTVSSVQKIRSPTRTPQEKMLSFDGLFEACAPLD